MKNIEVLIKFPADWFNIDQTDLTAVIELREMIEKTIKEEIAEIAYSKLEIVVPKVEITKEEVKDRMLDILAERALSQGN